MNLVERLRVGTPMVFGPSLADDASTSMAVPPAMVLEHLSRRFSVGPKYLTLPAPSPDELLLAAAVALRAPDHAGLSPFRFVRVGVHQRDRLGSLFAQDAVRRGHSIDEIERARQRAHNGPALLALVGRVRTDVDEVPAHEQWLCIGAGLMNFLNALHMMGFGAKTLSGASVRDPAIQRAFCEDGECLIAWIVTGTPTRNSHAKRLDDATRVLTDW